MTFGNLPCNLLILRSFMATNQKVGCSSYPGRTIQSSNRNTSLFSVLWMPAPRWRVPVPVSRLGLLFPIGEPEFRHALAVPAIPGQEYRAVYQHDAGYEAIRHPDGSA